MEDYKSFCEWLASEIFSENWEFNKDGFEEIACRKLVKLGIVKEVDGEYVLESEEQDMDKCIEKPNRCPYCNDGQALVTGQTDDYGIAIHYPKTLVAYGYDIHGSNSNGLCIEINFCPMCGRELGQKK